VSARLRAVYERVTSWQRRTFPHQTAAGLLAHMRKELVEIEAAPDDVEERADMAILAMGVLDRLEMDPGFDVDASAMMLWGYWRPTRAIGELEWLIGKFETGNNTWRLVRVLAGCTRGILSLDSEDKFLDAIEAKMDKNEDRRWPAPADQVPGQPVEHIREVVCAHCNDTRRMSIGEREVPCTRCPRPCEECRSGGYCRSVPCSCRCHVPASSDEELHVDNVIAALTPAPAILESELEEVRMVLAAMPHESAAMAARRIVDLSAARRADIVSLEGERNRLLEERAEWRDDNERLRAERRKIRSWLQATPNEGAVEAVARLIRETNAERWRRHEEGES
jgi:hypothetical protein